MTKSEILVLTLLLFDEITENLEASKIIITTLLCNFQKNPDKLSFTNFKGQFEGLRTV